MSIDEGRLHETIDNLHIVKGIYVTAIQLISRELSVEDRDRIATHLERTLPNSKPSGVGTRTRSLEDFQGMSAERFNDKFSSEIVSIFRRG